MPNPIPMQDFICFDSLSDEFISPIGAVAAGREVTFRLRLSKRANGSAPRLLVYEADRWDTPILISPMTFLRDEAAVVWYQARFSPPQPKLLFYRFDMQEDSGVRRPVMRTPEGLGVLGEQANGHWQLTVYDGRMTTPPAIAGGLIYQIFPDRFFNSGQPKQNVPADRNLRQDWGGEPVWQPDETGEFRCNDYFGGDLEGIRQKLPYLERLGVTAVYLNPVFEAHSNHRYNTADYTKIDPLLGGEEDLRALCRDAAERGIAVILDGVFSHVGSDSVYMNREGRYGENAGAYRDPNSRYRPWFRFDEYPGRYRSWWNFITLPEVEEENPDYLEFIAGESGVISRWMDAGVAGWRLDVADELPDGALDAICAAIRRKDPDAPIIGEVWEDASNKIAYGVRRRYLLGRQLTGVMNYPLTDAILAFVRNGDAYSLFHVLMTQLRHYPPPVLHGLMNSLSTHDIERAITALAGEPANGAGRDWQHAHNTLSPEQLSHGKRLLKLAALLQYTLPGVPCLYYGDEAGMCGYRDPFNRGCYPWGNEDAALVEFFCTLGTLRRESSCLAQGEFSLVRMSGELFAFVRRDAQQALFVAANRGHSPCTPPLPPDLRPGAGKVLLGDADALTIPAFGMLVMRWEFS